MRSTKEPTNRRLLFQCCVVAFWASSGWLQNGQGAVFFAQAQRQGQFEVECSPSQVNYDWQRWNYYELLGLTRPSDPLSSLDAKNVRRAYRKQAQLWHPDKQLVGHNTTGSSTTSKEEATARFAQIAQAYEVLSDDWKRKEYDLFLQYCDNLQEEEERAEMLRRPHWSKLFSNFGDPFRVFEDFFFGRGDGIDEEEEHEEDAWFFDMPPRNSDPIRITKHQDEFRDTLTYEVIVRISQTEEYRADSSGRYYYRIVSQDFVKEVDPFTGAMALQPITRPYLRKEGHRAAKPRQEELPRQSLLFPGDVLTPKSALLVSSNRRYYAGLSPDCELIIMADNAFGEDTLVWSSDSPFSSFGGDKNHQQESCFATLRGPHLVVALGRPEMPHRILWYSEALEEQDEDYFDSSSSSSSTSSSFATHSVYSSPSTYLAQLDNDGSLVIYKVWSPSPQLQELPLSTRAWLATRQYWKGATRDDQYQSLLLGSSTTAGSRSLLSAGTYKRCMYATGPLGCHRLARRFYQLSLEIYFRVKALMGKMDEMFDAWMDLIMEEDSYLEALKQSTSGLGSQIVNKSARLVRRLLELVMLRGEK